MGALRYRVLILFLLVFSVVRADDVCVSIAPTGSCSTSRAVKFVCDSQQLCTCDAGTWVCTTPGVTSPGGSNTNVQFNDSGAFFGENSLTWNKATDALFCDGSIDADRINLVRYANGYATGGDGTSGNPWTGWEAPVVSGITGGATIVMSTGSYRISTPLRLPSKTRLECENGAVLTAAANLNDNMITNQNWDQPSITDTDIEIHGCRLDGNKSNQSATNPWTGGGTQNTLSGILLTGVDRVRVARNTIVDVKSVGIFLTLAASGQTALPEDNAITGNVITGPNDNCIRTDGSGVSGVLISGNICRDQGVPAAGSGGGGIRADANVVDHVITGNTVEAAETYGIRTTGGTGAPFVITRRVVILGNYVTGTKATSSTGTGISTSGNNVALVGNVSHSNAGSGIECSSADVATGIAVTIVGNTTSDNQKNGIISSGCRQVSVVGNVSGRNAIAGTFGGIVAQDNASPAVDSNEVLISGNVLYDDQATPTQDYGIWIGAGSEATLGENRVTGATSQSYRLDGTVRGGGDGYIGGAGAANVRLNFDAGTEPYPNLTWNNASSRFEPSHTLRLADPAGTGIKISVAHSDGAGAALELANTDAVNEEASPNLFFQNGGPGQNSENMAVRIDSAGHLNVYNDAGTSQLQVQQDGDASLGGNDDADITLSFDQGTGTDPRLAWDDSPGQFEFDFDASLTGNNPSIESGAVGLGTGGVLKTAVEDSASAVAFDLRDTVVRTQGDLLKLGEATNYRMRVTWDGRFAFGYGGQTPQTGHILSFLQQDTATPDGAPITVGVLAAIRHSDVAETADRLLGIVGNAAADTPTGWTSDILGGTQGTGTGSNDATGYSGKVVAGLRGVLDGGWQLTSIEQRNRDSAGLATAVVKGDYGHATTLWLDYHAPTSSMSLPANRPTLISGARVPIQGWSSTAGEQWGIYGEAPTAGFPSTPAIGGFMRVPFGERGTRRTALYFVPFAAAAGNPTGNAKGDVYFDDGTNNTAGLWEHDGTAWRKTLNSSSGLANPTATVGLTTVNGTAGTALRSDGAPALSQAITPTWTALHKHDVVPQIKAGASAGHVARPGGVICQSVTQVGNTALTETDLFTCIVPADALNTDGQRLYLEVAGEFGSGVSVDKRIRLKFGATVIFDTGTLSLQNNEWRAECTIARTGAATQKSICEFIASGTTLAFSPIDFTTPAETLSGAVTLRGTGIGTNANDTIHEMSHVEWRPQP